MSGAARDVSAARIIEGLCPQCGAHYKAEVLDVIDLGAQPQLVARLRRGEHLRVVCPNGHVHTTDMPLLVRRPEGGLLFVPGKATSADDDGAALERLLTALPATARRRRRST